MNTISIDLIMLSFHRQVLPSNRPPPPPPHYSPPLPRPLTRLQHALWKPIRVRRSNLSSRYESYRNPFVSKEAIFTSARVLTNQADERQSMAKGPWTTGVSRGHLVFLLLLPPPSSSFLLFRPSPGPSSPFPETTSGTLRHLYSPRRISALDAVRVSPGDRRPLPDDAVQPK